MKKETLTDKQRWKKYLRTGEVIKHYDIKVWLQKGIDSGESNRDLHEIWAEAETKHRGK